MKNQSKTFKVITPEPERDIDFERDLASAIRELALAYYERSVNEADEELELSSHNIH